MRLKVLITSVLTFILLVACSAADDSTDVKKDTASTDESNETASTDESDEKVEINMMTHLLADVPDMDNEFYTKLEEMTNSSLNLTWVPINDYDERFDLVMTSGDIPEIIVQGDYRRPTLLQGIEQGAFWDLTDFLGDFSQYPNLRDNLTPDSWNYVDYDGKIMGVPRSRANIDHGIMMRKDWLDEFDIPVPKTLDEFYDALLTITSEKDDVVGMLHDPLSSSSFWGAFDVSAPTYDEDGGLIRDILTPQFTEMVAWFRQAYADGLLPTEYSALSDANKFDMLTTGRAVAFGYSIYRVFPWNNDIQKNDPEGELIVIPPLEGPNGIAATLDIGTRGAKYISSKVPEEKVPKILEYFDKTASEEVTHHGYYGIEGVHHELIDGQPVLTELGEDQVQVRELNPLVPAFNEWGKVHYAGASKEENEGIEEVASLYGEEGRINPFSWLSSEKYNDAWPNYDNEFQSMVTRTVVGDESMEAFEEYVESLRNQPDLKEAFQEYAKDFEERSVE